LICCEHAARRERLRHTIEQHGAQLRRFAMAAPKGALDARQQAARADSRPGGRVHRYMTAHRFMHDYRG